MQYDLRRAWQRRDYSQARLNLDRLSNTASKTLTQRTFQAAFCNCNVCIYMYLYIMYMSFLFFSMGVSARLCSRSYLGQILLARIYYCLPFPLVACPSVPCPPFPQAPRLLLPCRAQPMYTVIKIRTPLAASQNVNVYCKSNTTNSRST